MSTAPVSIPTDPPMPNRPQYGMYDIATVRHFQSRTEYQLVFGQPKQFDHAKRQKNWFDSTVGNAPTVSVKYLILTTDSSGQPAIGFQTMSALEASDVNIPGTFIYFPRQIKPTTAFVQLAMTGMPVNMQQVALESEAKDITAALQPLYPNLSLKYREAQLGSAGIAVYEYPDTTDPRRVFEVYDANSGTPLANVGQMLVKLNAAGVGAPGHWQIDSGGPTWTRDQTIDVVTDPKLIEWPVPVRQLFPVEKLVLSFGGTLTIQRTDLLAIPADPSGAAAGGGYTAADRQVALETHAWMMSLAKQMGL